MTWRADRRRRISGLLLLTTAALLGTSCGGPDTAAAEAQIAKMLPESTAAVIRIESLDVLDKRKRQLAETMAEQDSSLGARDLLALSRIPIGDVRLIDSRLPIVIAVTSKRATPATITALLPTTDPAAYQKSLEGMGITPVIEGNYFAVPIFGKYKQATTASDALAKLRPGAISVHANLETLTKTYKLLIDSGIEWVEKQYADLMAITDPNADTEVLAEFYGSLAHAVASSAKAIDITIDYRDGHLDLDVSFDALPGSSMADWSSPASDLAPLARGMTGEGTMEVLMQLDTDKLMPQYNALLQALGEAYTPEFQKVMADMNVAYRDIYGQISSGVAVEGDMFNAQGLNMTAHMMPKDPEQFIQQMLEAFKMDALQRMGIVADDAKISTDDGTKIYDVQVRMDYDKLMAMTGQKLATAEQSEMVKKILGDGMNTRIAHRGDRVAIAIGKDRAAGVISLLQTDRGTWSPLVQAALKRVEGCNPMLIERIDIGRMMTGAAGMRESSSGTIRIPKDASSNVLIYAGIQGNQWRAGVSFDVSGFGAMMQQMIPR